MKKNMVTIILLQLFLMSFLNAQEIKYPYLWKVLIQARISCDTSNGIKMFYYSYTLTNFSTNIGSIDGLRIDVSRNPNSIEIDTIGLKFRNDGYTEKFAREDLIAKAGKIIPVGFIQVPEESGLMAYSNALTADFDVIENRIKPGETLNNFVMMSKGLPGIRRCIVSPYFDVDSLFPNPEETEELFALVDSIRDAVNYYGCTIGPTSPPKNFVAFQWCDTLTSYTRQSLELGWIKSRTTAKKYLNYFNIAKTNLERNNFYTVKAILKEVLREVDKDSTNNITSEAYALLRYNTEYLIEQIPEPSQMTVQELINALIAQLKWTYDNKQLGDRTFYKELDTHLREAKRFYEKKDTIRCAQEIEEFYNTIRREYNLKRKDHRYITEEGYGILYPLAREIETKVLTLPPKPTGTIYEQIEAVKRQLRIESQADNIRGSSLIGSLEKLLGRAQRELQRRDILKAEMNMELYLQTVKQSYTYTKVHPRSMLYLNSAGYISLYYRGRYVVEELRGGEEPPMEKIREIEKEIESEEADYRALQEEMKEEK